MIKKITQDLNAKVLVTHVEGLLANYVRENNVDFLVRGIRSHADLDSEIIMAVVNRRLCDVETIFLMARTGHIHISSSIVRDLATHNAKLPNFIPPEIEDEVIERLFNHYSK